MAKLIARIQDGLIAFIADPRQHFADRAAVLGDVQAAVRRARRGHLPGTRYKECAFLWLPFGHLSSLSIHL
jgi:hypothetical protein